MFAWVASMRRRNFSLWFTFSIHWHEESSDTKELMAINTNVQKYKFILKCVVHAINVCFDIAKKLSYEYFFFYQKRRINWVAFVSGYFSRFSGSTFEFMFTIHMPYNLYSKVLSTKLSLMKSDYVYSDFHFLSVFESDLSFNLFVIIRTQINDMKKGLKTDQPPSIFFSLPMIYFKYDLYTNNKSVDVKILNFVV